MSRLPPLRRDDLDETGGALWDLIVSTRSSAVIDEDGGLRGPFNPWLHAPELGRRAAELGWHLRSGSSVERRLLELAIITTGARWKSEFEWWAHVPMARQYGVSDDVIDAIGRGEDPPISNDDERAVYTAAKQLSEDGRLDAGTYAAARRVSRRCRDGRARLAGRLLRAGLVHAERVRDRPATRGHPSVLARITRHR